MKANRIVLLSLLMLSILVSGCGTSASNSSETYESTIVETTETIQMPEAVYEFPVMVSENRRLTISLLLEEFEDFSAKEIWKIEVYDGNQLLQTITKDDIPEEIAVRYILWISKDGQHPKVFCSIKIKITNIR